VRGRGGGRPAARARRGGRPAARAETDEEAQRTSIARVELKQDTIAEEDRRRFSRRRTTAVTVIFGG
jgi:hypothetical protein